MSLLKTKLLFAFILFFGFLSYSQNEVLRNMPAAAVLEDNERLSKKSQVQNGNLVFLIDTLNLPFVDDFAKNRFKVFDETARGQRIDSVRYFFRVNRFNTPDRFFFSADTTYNLIYDQANNRFDSLAILPDTVSFYESDSIINLVTRDSLVWPIYFMVDSAGTVYTDSVAPSGSFTNQIDTFTFVFDSPYYLWLNEGAYHNYTFSNTAPTLGMVTLDGTDATGVPYDMTGNISGLADRLISKPIRLSGTQNVVLSFFYQATGNGEDPDRSDSLTLRMKTPQMSEWLWLWGDTGTLSTEWKRVALEIPDTFLEDGTQFMFENYATLNGSFDHWHIDYVQLDENRRPSNDTLVDIAFVRSGESYISPYTAMPYDHFKASPSTFLKTEQLFNCFNLEPTAKLMTSNYDVVDGITNSSVFTSSVVGQPVASPVAPNLAPEDSFKVRHSVPLTAFPITSDSVMDYKIVQRISSTPDENPWNDTLIHIQKFDTYYAYDDGSAEKAYKLLDQPRVQLAQRYQSAKPDSLRAVLVNFPFVEEANTTRRIQFKVWNDLSSSPIYEGVIQNAPYTNLNRFYRAEFSEPVPVSGEFYIGWEQIQGLDLWVGFDANTIAPNTLFYQLDGAWYSSVVSGALMLRPDFGNANIDPIGREELQKESPALSVFPNPNNGSFTFSTDKNVKEFHLTDLTGRSIGFTQFQNHIQLSDSFSGMALLRVVFEDGSSTFAKIQIFH